MSLADDIDELRWEEFERLRRKRDNEACGYYQIEDAEDSDPEITAGYGRRDS